MKAPIVRGLTAPNINVMKVPGSGRAIATDRPAQSASAAGAEIDDDRDARIHPRRNGEKL